MQGLLLHARLWNPSCVPWGKVLFIHGLGGSTFSWRHAPAYLLPTGLFLVAVDLPGFGYSTRERTDHALRAQAGLLWEFLDLLEQEGLVPPSLQGKPWFLMGHSMGGGIALVMAMQRSEQTEGVVLVAPAFGKKGLHVMRPLLSCALVRGFFVTFFRRAFLSSSRIRRFLTSAYGRQPSQEELSGYLVPLKRQGTARVLLELVATSSRVRLSDFQGKPHPPFLVLLGTEDCWVEQDTRHFLKAFPEAHFQAIEGASHCPMETHPESCYPLILDFLRSLR